MGFGSGATGRYEAEGCDGDGGSSDGELPGVRVRIMEAEVRGGSDAGKADERKECAQGD